MLSEKDRLFVTDASASPAPIRSKSLYRRWNQLPRFQRKLILINILVAFFLFLLVLQKFQADLQHIVEDDVDGPRLIRITVAPFGKKESQEETEAARQELQQYVKRKHEEITALILIFGAMFANDDLKRYDELDRTPLTFAGPQNERQRAVVVAFEHAWDGYKRFAWGHDNVRPTSKNFYEEFHLGMTIIESLDTLYIMNLEKEFNRAKHWVEEHLDFKEATRVSFHQVTTRVLGGLLSAYRLTGSDVFLSKASELGELLQPAFNTTTDLPYTIINLQNGVGENAEWIKGIPTAEVSSFQLEFNYLSWATNNTVYEELAYQVNQKMRELKKKGGLAYTLIEPDGSKFDESSSVNVGASVISFYEYLLKQWIQTGKQDDYLMHEYRQAISGIIMYLTQGSPKQKHLFLGELMGGHRFKPGMEHFVCSLPGTLLLGYSHGLPETHLHLAEGLLDTCYQMYLQQPTNLAPDRTYFDGELKDMRVDPNEASYALRPEFVESLYYFYALTGKPKFQEMGWKIFLAIQKYTKVPNGYTSIGNVLDTKHTYPMDMEETFFFSNTLKYLYLLFSDNRHEIDLNKFVFNAEAHISPVSN